MSLCIDLRPILRTSPGLVRGAPLFPVSMVALDVQRATHVMAHAQPWLTAASLACCACFHIRLMGSLPFGRSRVFNTRNFFQPCLCLGCLLDCRCWSSVAPCVVCFFACCLALFFLFPTPPFPFLLWCCGLRICLLGLAPFFIVRVFSCLLIVPFLFVCLAQGGGTCVTWM